MKEKILIVISISLFLFISCNEPEKMSVTIDFKNKKIKYISIGMCTGDEDFFFPKDSIYLQDYSSYQISVWNSVYYLKCLYANFEVKFKDINYILLNSLEKNLEVINDKLIGSYLFQMRYDTLSIYEKLSLLKNSFSSDIIYKKDLNGFHLKEWKNSKNYFREYNGITTIVEDSLEVFWSDTTTLFKMSEKNLKADSAWVLNTAKCFTKNGEINYDVIPKDFPNIFVGENCNGDE